MSPETLKAIAYRWTAHTTHTTDVPDLVEEIVRQKEQVRRLREALLDMMDYDRRNSTTHAAAEAIIKETAT